MLGCPQWRVSIGESEMRDRHGLHSVHNESVDLAPSVKVDSVERRQTGLESLSPEELSVYGMVLDTASYKKTDHTFKHTTIVIDPKRYVSAIQGQDWRAALKVVFPYAEIGAKEPKNGPITGRFSKMLDAWAPLADTTVRLRDVDEMEKFEQGYKQYKEQKAKAGRQH